MENNLHVDPKQIQHLHELGGSSLVVKMIGLFLENAPLRIQEIHQAEEQNNWEGVFQAVHKLKSSSGNFGAHSVFELCGKIEILVRSKQTEGLIPQLRELESQLECVLTALQREKERIEV